MEQNMCKNISSTASLKQPNDYAQKVITNLQQCTKAADFTLGTTTQESRETTSPEGHSLL